MILKISRVLQVAYKLITSSNQIGEVKFIKPLYCLHQFVCLKRPESADIRVSRYQKLQKVPNMNNTPLNMSFQEKLVNMKRQALTKSKKMLNKKLLSVHFKLFQACLCLIYRVHKMDWTVNDNLYNRFLKWRLKCEKY